MYPDTLIANFVEKKFGDYGNALYIINGSQLILIIVTLIVWLCW